MQEVHPFFLFLNCPISYRIGHIKLNFAQLIIDDFRNLRNLKPTLLHEILPSPILESLMNEYREEEHTQKFNHVFSQKPF